MFPVILWRTRESLVTGHFKVSGAEMLLLNTLRITRYVHPHPPVHVRVQVHCIGREECVCDRFQLPRHVGSRIPSSEGGAEMIPSFLRWTRESLVMVIYCWLIHIAHQSTSGYGYLLLAYTYRPSVNQWLWLFIVGLYI